MDGSAGRSSADYRQKEERSEPKIGLSPREDGTAGDDGREDSLFVRHRVRKRDTLAGLAVKYNIAVSDIKRANGFESDTAMFGRELLLIPTKPLPIGPEYAAWAALLVSEISKIQGSSSTGNLRPSMAAALSELRGYYSTGQTPTGTPLDGSDDEDVEEFGQIKSSKLGNSRSRGGRGREVELSALPLTNRAASNNGAPAVGLTEERLRRRKHADDLKNCNLTPFEHASSLQSAFAERSNGGAIAQGQFSHQPGQSFDFNFSTSSRRGSLHARGASAGDVLGELRVWHRKSLVWKDQFFQRLKKAASNSSLLAPRTSADNLQVPSTSLSMSGPLVDRSASVHITSHTSSGSMSGAAQGPRGGPHPQKDSHKAD